MTPASTLRATAAAACAALLAACAQAPSYQRPEMPAPAAFKEAAAGPWRLANPAAAAVPDAWWEMFSDPVLNQLEAGVAIGNQNIAATVAQYRQAQAAVAATRASLFPTLSADLSAGRSGSGASGTAGRATTSYGLGASASWEIDLWGRIAAGVSAAQARAQASADDLAAMRLSVQSTLAQNYFALRATEAQIALLDRTIEAYQRSLQLTQNRYRAGIAISSDVAQAETQLKSAQAQRLESVTGRAQLEHAIAVLLGKAPADFSIAATGLMPPAPDVPVQLPSTLLERRPDIAAAERRVAAANAEIGQARAAFFPSLALSASAGFRGSSLGSLVSSPNLVWSLGPALALAIFDGGARQAAVDSARAATDQAAANYRQTVLTAFQEVEDNLVLCSNLIEVFRLQTEALAAARKTLEVTQNQYRSGTVSYLNVASAQATVLSAERSLLDVQNRRLAALNELLKNIAGRWDVLLPQANP